MSMQTEMLDQPEQRRLPSMKPSPFEWCVIVVLVFLGSVIVLQYAELERTRRDRRELSNENAQLHRLVAIMTREQKGTAWNHHCTNPGNDAGLVNIGATQTVWHCGCGKSGTNNYPHVKP